MRRSDIDAGLAELYAQIPEIPGCKGRCWTSCGPIDMSDRERQRIREQGIRIMPREQALAQVRAYWCEGLSNCGRCRVYDIRPLICRLWGATESTRCPYGCRPVPRYLTDREGLALVSEAYRIGGGRAELAMSGTDILKALDEAHPDLRTFALGLVRNGTALEAARADRYDDLPPEITSRRH